MCRNLDFPIDCPVCKVSIPDSDDEVEDPQQPLHGQVSQQSLLDRTQSDYITDQLNLDAVDPQHALQLHASHSTPSLETASTESGKAGNAMAGASRHDDKFGGKEPPAQIEQEKQQLNGFVSCPTPFDAMPVHDESVPAVINGGTQTSAVSKQHDGSPSFPQLVTETPITPSLIPSDDFVRQHSHSLFSPHDLTQIAPAELALSSSAEMSRAEGQASTGMGLQSDPKGSLGKDGFGLADAEGITDKQDEMSRRSVSLGMFLML